MLQQLHIQNYAIIKEISIDFSGKLNIITGETGAGKSILVGALSLILGERADTSVLLNSEKKCVVEATFNIRGKKEVQQFLRENNLDVEEDLVIRREISSNGKSRAFINDTPVNLGQLQDLSSSLVDLHQQFDTAEMANTHFQREVLDALSGNADLLAGYQKIYRQLQTVKKALISLNDEKSRFNKEFDYTKFLHDEIAEAGFTENELEDLESELKILNNSEGIKAVLSKAFYELKEGEQPMVPGLKMLGNQLQLFADYHPALQPIIQRVQSAQIELQDVAEEIERLNDHVNYDAKRVDHINERISIGYRLLKKHGARTTSELLAVKKTLEEKLQAVLNIDETIAIKEKEFGQLFNEASQYAKKISANRHKHLKPLEEKVNGLLVQVGMPNARLRVLVEPSNLKSRTPVQNELIPTGTFASTNDSESLQLYGIDDIEFLFDANKSAQFAPLRKIASGGELSRLMLCIKSLVAQSIDLPTMIFDEIDTGISGEAARQVGIIMKELSTDRQIICITHQPQIAGKADVHFYVYKQDSGDTVKASIKRLTPDERITTIAQMLSGEKPTAAALENAREMVGN